MRLNFLDKLDYAIFKNVNPDHEPVTGGTICNVFIASVVMCLIVFVCQMCNVNDKVLNVIAGIGLLCIAGWAIYAALPTIKAFNGPGGKIGYVAYSLVLTALSFVLAMWATLILLAGLLIYGIAKVFFAPKQKAIITYSDGSKEMADVETGICGEKTAKGRDTGNEFSF